MARRFIHWLRKKREEGSATFVVLMIVVLLGFAALVIDIGYIRTVQAQLATACDAGSLAGAAVLDGTEGGLSDAIDESIHIGNLNIVNGSSPELVASDVTLGEWDGATFVATYEPEHVNAVQIVKQVLGVPTLFAPAAFGTDEMGAGAQCLAALPPPEPATEVDCFLPLAIPACRFDADGNPLPDLSSIVFQMTSANADNAAWGLPQRDNPSEHEIVAVLRDDCPVVGTMDDGRVSLNTGAMADAFRELAEAVNASERAWDAQRWGALPEQMDHSLIDDYGDHVLEGALMLFEPPAGYCDDSNHDGVPDAGGFNEDDLEIAGIAWAVVFDVKGQGNGQPVCTGHGRDRVCTTDSSAGNIGVKLDMTYEGTIGTGGGGDLNTGVLYQPPPRLVQ